MSSEGWVFSENVPDTEDWVSSKMSLVLIWWGKREHNLEELVDQL